MPPFLKIQLQRHPMDCAVVCLAMLLGLEYEEVLMAFRHNVMAEGATLKQLRTAATRLGHKIHEKPHFDMDTATGIIDVRSGQWHNDHLVVLKDGMIFDTDATVWEADVFLSAYAATPLRLLYVKEEN